MGTHNSAKTQQPGKKLYMFFISIYINIRDNFSELEKGGNQFITAYRIPMCLIKQMGKITFESEVHICADAK